MIKKYLLLCLIVLQFIAPLIHAHAFGHDSFKEHNFHLHSDEIGNISNANSGLNQTYVTENEQVGAVTTVANGIRTSLADDIAVIAVFFTLAFLIVSIASRFASCFTQFLRTQQNLYSHQNPRAPPR